MMVTQSFLANFIFITSFQIFRTRGSKLLKEIHEGLYGNHLGGQTLASKILKYGYNWPTIIKDPIEIVRKCDRYQKIPNIPRQPPTNFISIIVLCLFAQWGLDLFGELPKACQNNFIMAIIDYFSKWIEMKPLATITVLKSESSYGTIFTQVLNTSNHVVENGK